MKKLLGILVLGLLLSSKVYAEEKINLICKYLNSYYVSWDQGMFGETIVDESRQDSINFSIVKSNMQNRFETNFLTDWDWIGGSKIQDSTSDGEYKFLMNKDNQYMVIKLNRYDGNLEFKKGYTDDDGKYSLKDNYKCKTAVQQY